jgi:outer membrane receptor protein involved in Fe transport
MDLRISTGRVTSVQATRRLRLALAISAAAPVLALAAAAHAAAAAAPTDEVVVTAEKRSETLREVPQSVSVVSADKLEKQQAFSLQDFVSQVPNLSIAQEVPGQGRVVLRGVNTGGVASTVAIYMDETPFGSSSGLANGAVLASDFDTFDVARVEVLRGPQGTLYGASSLGGVLKYVTRAPELGSYSLRAQGSAAAVEGGDADYSADGVANAPLGDKAAVRASGFYRRLGGWIDQVGTDGSLTQQNANWGEVYGGRASVLVDPVDKLSVRLSALLQNVRNGSNSFVDADPVTGKPLYGGLTQSQYYPSFSNVDYRVYNGTVNWDLGLASLVSSTSYATLGQNEAQDATKVQAAPGLTFGDLATAFFGAPGQTLGVVEPQTNHQEKWTQEVRLASPSSQRLEWMVGGYYTHETADLEQVLNAFDTSAPLKAAGIPALETISLKSTYEEIAGFADATLHVTRQFSVAVGGRYSHNSQHAQEIVDGALVGGQTAFTPGLSSEGVFTYSVAPKFEINPNATVYARVAKGYRPGGPNDLPPGAPAGVPTSYKSDSLVSYEAGLKADFLDHRVSLDASAFYLDWTNIQLLAVVNSFGVNTNGGTAVSKGVEFALTARPTDELTLSASGALTNAKLTKDTDPIIGGLKGDRLPFAPKWSLTLDGDYEHPLADGFSGFAGATLALVGEQSPDFDTAYQAAFGHRFVIPSYARLDLRAGVRKDRWMLEVFAKNVANSQGLINVNAYGQLPAGALGVTPQRPRTVGASLTAHF